MIREVFILLDINTHEQLPIELQTLLGTAEAESPLVKLLLSVIGTLQTHLNEQSKQLSQQSEQLAQQSTQLEQLLSEIRRLKKLSAKPKLRASTLPKNPDDEDKNGGGASGNSGGGKRAGSEKRSKNQGLKIEEEQIITAEDIPVGATAYLEKHNVAPWVRARLQQAEEKLFFSKINFEAHVVLLGITVPHHIRLVTEAALVGSILANGFLTDTVILSDDAGQFNVFQPALCWIHAERGIKALIPGNRPQVNAVEWARNEIWELYHALLDYKKHPHPQFAIEIAAHFDSVCQTKTDYHALNHVLKRLFKNKEELLLVLRRPDIPLHNNLSEGDIREYVKRGKISGGTRSDEGRKCRDTFASLKKTALKMGIGFWNFLLDRTYKKAEVPTLDQLIIASAMAI